MSDNQQSESIHQSLLLSFAIWWICESL